MNNHNVEYNIMDLNFSYCTPEFIFPQIYGAFEEKLRLEYDIGLNYDNYFRLREITKSRKRFDMTITIRKIRENANVDYTGPFLVISIKDAYIAILNGPIHNIGQIVLNYKSLDRIS